VRRAPCLATIRQAADEVCAEGGVAQLPVSQFHFAVRAPPRPETQKRSAPLRRLRTRVLATEDN
jgi:hypothetical protein